ncbi:MAG: DUF3601 domain-containing protein [Rhizobiaceae bacterium]|nr:DUF3601 domain-containing protein [Rhizobiaceae bacterium]
MPEGRQSKVYPHLRDFQHLVIGRRYRVVMSFTDYDRGEHPVGEEWIFEGHSFLPYDDGLSLFVAYDDGRTQQIRMRWAPEDQGPVIDGLRNYIRKAQ